MSEALVETVAPIRRTLRVKASQEKAFRVFTGRMGDWWPKSHSLLQTPQKDVVIEPSAGGRWYEIGEDGTDYPWGRVLEWSPFERVRLAWQLTSAWAYDADFETEVVVTFRADGDHTVVEFEHRDLERYGDKAAAQRDGMDRGWGQILEGFAAVAES
jgi:uncharacterized protein YndB with AHSA1/START domain